jgi:hypothetical protein
MQDPALDGPPMRHNKALALALTATADARLWNRQPFAPGYLGQSMIRKSGNRFSEKIMLKREILR